MFEKLSAAMSRMVAYQATLASDDPSSRWRTETRVEGLAEAVRALEARVSGRPVVAPAVDVRQRAQRDWERVSPDFSALSRRAVRVLTSDASSLMQDAFWDGLRQSEILKSSRTLAERLLEAYDTGWTPQLAERIGATLRDALGAHEQCSVKARVFRDQRGFIGSNAGNEIADFVVRERIDPAASPEVLHLAKDGALLEAVRDSVLFKWVERLRRARTLSDRRTLLEYGFAVLIKGTGTEGPVRAEALTAAIESVNDHESELIAFLRSTVLGGAQFGDPRKPANSSKWSLVAKTAVRRFVQWLAKEDLRFFFETVMENTPDPHGRQAFWNAWLEHPRMVNSCVALSTRDLLFLRSRGVLPKDAAFSRVSGGADDVSAFLLRFSTATGDLIAIEFSQVGNAAYFHHGEAFDKRVGGLHRPLYDLSRDLKNKSTEIRPPRGLSAHWDWHTTGWQDRFSSALSLLLR